MEKKVVETLFLLQIIEISKEMPRVKLSILNQSKY